MRLRLRTDGIAEHDRDSAVAAISEESIPILRAEALGPWTQLKRKQCALAVAAGHGRRVPLAGRGGIRRLPWRERKQYAENHRDPRRDRGRQEQAAVEEMLDGEPRITEGEPGDQRVLAGIRVPRRADQTGRLPHCNPDGRDGQQRAHAPQHEGQAARARTGLHVIAAPVGDQHPQTGRRQDGGREVTEQLDLGQEGGGEGGNSQPPCDALSSRKADREPQQTDRRSRGGGWFRDIRVDGQQRGKGLQQAEVERR